MHKIGFFNFGLCNFFLVLFSGDPTVESERSREFGLYKVPLDFWYNKAEIFRPTQVKSPDCIVHKSLATYELLIDILFSGKSQLNITENKINDFGGGVLKCLIES